MNELVNIYNDFGWEEAEGYPKGTRIKTLRKTDSAMTALIKLPKGFSISSHSHINTEQHFVLEGECESEGKTYYSDTYRIIKVHQDHGPFRSKNGSLILVIWDK